MPEKYLYDRVTESQLVQFIEQWMDVLSHLARFTRANRLVAKIVHALYEELPTVMDQAGRVEFTELHNSLLVNEAALSLRAQDSEPVAAFLFVMLKHNLRRLRLERGLGEPQFFDLLERLAQPAERSIEDGERWAAPLSPHVVFEAQVRLERPSSPAATAAREPDEEAAGAVTAAVRPGELPVPVLVRVGSLALYGAAVCWADDPASTVATQGEKGCTLYAAPGERELLVRYDEYEVRQRVAVRVGMKALEVDLQKIFDYGGS